MTDTWTELGALVRQRLGTPTAEGRTPLERRERLYFKVERAVAWAAHTMFPYHYNYARFACKRGDGEPIRRIRRGEHAVYGPLYAYFRAHPVPTRHRAIRWVGPEDAMTWDQLLARVYAHGNPEEGLRRVDENEPRHLTDAVVDYFYQQALAVSGL